MKIFSCLFFTFMFISATIHAYSPLPKEFKVNPNQVWVTEEGIFAYLEEEQQMVIGQELSIDKCGNMVLKEVVLAKGPCYIHDLWCRRCGGCGVLFCPMNCSCFD